MADVAPAESLGPADAIDRRVGSGPRLGEGGAGGGDIQHAPAGGDQPAVLVAPGPGVEDGDAGGYG